MVLERSFSHLLCIGAVWVTFFCLTFPSFWLFFFNFQCSQREHNDVRGSWRGRSTHCNVGVAACLGSSGVDGRTDGGLVGVAPFHVDSVHLQSEGLL